MKTNTITRILLCAFLAAGIAAPAVAGPGPHVSYLPVTTMKQAQSIQPGTRIAVECPICGGIKTMTADKDRSWLHELTCERCKAKFVLQQDAHGGSRGAYVCQDASGHKAKLLVAL